MVQEQVTTGFSTYNKINIPCDIQSLFINEIYDTMVYRFLSEWRKNVLYYILCSDLIWSISGTQISANDYQYLMFPVL